jgi:hypothetical protein
LAGAGAAGAAAAGAAAGAAGAVSCLLQADNMAAEATAINAKRREIEIPFINISLDLKEKSKRKSKKLLAYFAERQNFQFKRDSYP